MDIYLHEVFEIAGHDGSEIVFPDLPDPARRRGHSPFEFITHAMKCGYVLSYFPVLQTLQHKVIPHGPREDIFCNLMIDGYKVTTTEWSRPLWLEQRGLNLYRKIRKEYDLLLMGQTKAGNYHHAAWCSKRNVVYDPAGQTEFKLYGFWAKIPWIKS
jgi:hypothetical protein